MLGRWHAKAGSGCRSGFIGGRKGALNQFAKWACCATASSGTSAMSGGGPVAKPRRAIALGSVELLAGVLLILHAGALIGVDRATPALDVVSNQPPPTASPVI